MPTTLLEKHTLIPGEHLLRKPQQVPNSHHYQNSAMNPGLVIFVCFSVITPVCAYGAWRFWIPMLQEHLNMLEDGEKRAAEGQPQNNNAV